MENFIYENKPYFFMAIASIGFYFSKRYDLSIGGYSALLLIICAGYILLLRSTYRQRVMQINKKIKKEKNNQNYRGAGAEYNYKNDL